MAHVNTFAVRFRPRLAFSQANCEIASSPVRKTSGYSTKTLAVKWGRDWKGWKKLRGRAVLIILNIFSLPLRAHINNRELLGILLRFSPGYLAIWVACEGGLWFYTRNIKIKIWLEELVVRQHYCSCLETFFQVHLNLSQDSNNHEACDLF